MPRGKGDNRPWRPPVRAALAVGAVLVVLLAGGCASIPSAVSVQSAPTPPPPGAGSAVCCRIIVDGPQPGWSAIQVVQGFLLASFSSADGYSVARKYLTPQASRLWHPGSEVTILTKTPTVAQAPPHEAVQAGGTGVTVTGQELATLDAGQYTPAPQGPPSREFFELQPVSGTYLISGLPPTSAGPASHELLLTDQFFQLEYTPHDLYYYGVGTGTLVPDPIFVPTEAADPVATLLTDLLHNPSGWLGDVAATDFPPGSRLAGPVRALPGPSGGRTALVDLRVPLGTSASRKSALAEQLVETLTSGASGPALFAAVRLNINGRTWKGPGGSLQLDQSTYPGAIAQGRANAPLYYLAGRGTYTLGASAPKGEPLAGAGSVQFRQVAVSPDRADFGGLSADGTTVDTASLTPVAGAARVSLGPLHPRLTGVQFTSLSWDTSGDLWVAGEVHHTPGLWVIPTRAGAPTRVRLPDGFGPVTAVRVAPDGVRVAMVVGTGAAAHIDLAAVTHGPVVSVLRTVRLGPGLPPVTSFTWYDEDHLLALTGPSSSAKLWEVPVDGDKATPVNGPSGMVSVTADGPGNPLYASMLGGRVFKSGSLSELWTSFTDGRSAVYPG